jgi:hypothetical protein
MLTLVCEYRNVMLLMLLRIFTTSQHTRHRRDWLDKIQLITPKPNVEKGSECRTFQLAPSGTFSVCVSGHSNLCQRTFQLAPADFPTGASLHQRTFKLAPANLLTCASESSNRHSIRGSNRCNSSRNNSADNNKSGSFLNPSEPVGEQQSMPNATRWQFRKMTPCSRPWNRFRQPM